MIFVDKEEILGLTLEEAIAYLVPQGWEVTIHQYEEDDISSEMPVRRDKDTISLDIQDGKIYDFVVYVNGIKQIDEEKDFL